MKWFPRPAYLYVEYDLPFLRVGDSTTITFDQIERAVCDKAPLIWDCRGNCRMIPSELIAHTWSHIQDCRALEKMGRIEELHGSIGFSWEQTVPLPTDGTKNIPCVVKEDTRSGSDDSGPTSNHP
jgi:hypothetical protein